MELSVIIPFFNEEKNVVNVLTETAEALKNAKVDYEIVAVDNGSRDHTSLLIDKIVKKNQRVRKVIVKENKGYGYGVVTGLRQGKGDFIGWIYGDGQVEPNYLIDVYQLAKKKGKAGLYKINRVLRYDGLQRKLFSRVYNLLMKIVFGVESTDINGCPKIFARAVFQRMNLQSKDWFIDTEILIKTKMLGIKIFEVVAKFNKRSEGQSNVDFSTVLEFIKNMVKYCFRT